MIDTCKTRVILRNVLLFTCLAGLFAPNSYADENSKYLEAVREFADNVLKYGRDTYGPKHTPLFVDGLNIHTHEPVNWIDPDGTRWILSNLASQQNLFRVLDGLTTITGDPKYRQAAIDAIKYAFDNLRSPNGLLHWGEATAYDAQADRVRGNARRHTLKAFYPYYELMWKVDPNATRKFIESFWSAHIIDWSNLDMCRIGYLDEQLEKAWDHQYKAGPVFFKSKVPWGTPFSSTGSDLYYAAAVLCKLSGQKEPLTWGKRLAHRYVETRNPKTGISGGVYSWNESRKPPAVDDSGNWILRFILPVGNPRIREAILGRVTISPGVFCGSTGICICQLMIGEMIGDDGQEFKQWALEELTAIGKAAYRQKDNSWIPMMTDGTSLEGVGDSVAWVANPVDFWAYAMAFRTTMDEFTWQMARNIAQGNGFADIGESNEEEPCLNRDTTCTNPFAVLGFLELYKTNQNPQFLEMARRVGDNILTARLNKGFFVPSDEHTYAKFNAIDSLVLLNLHATITPGSPHPPQVWPGLSFFAAPYRHKDRTTDNEELYELRGFDEAPVSLQEAAAIGNIELVRTFLRKGAEVDGIEDDFMRTALHRAATSGQKHVAELLLANGANANVKDVWPGGTPLHYAAEKGHKDIVELLMAKGADVNMKNLRDETPLHFTARNGHKDIAELLIKQRVDVNAKDTSGRTALHYAAREGHKDIVEMLLANGADVNIGEKHYSRTAAEFAINQNHTEIVELLVAKGADISPLHLAIYLKDEAKARSLIEGGADVNKRTPYGTTPLHRAVGAGLKDIVQLLIDKGADVNAKDNWDWTPLHSAVYSDNDIVGLLLVKGANVNAEDGDSRTPLWYAQEEGYAEIAELLRKRGAKER